MSHIWIDLGCMAFMVAVFRGFFHFSKTRLSTEGSTDARPWAFTCNIQRPRHRSMSDNITTTTRKAQFPGYSSCCVHVGRIRVPVYITCPGDRCRDGEGRLQGEKIDEASASKLAGNVVVSKEKGFVS